jgi:hypothetical protein
MRFSEYAATCTATHLDRSASQQGALRMISSPELSKLLVCTVLLVGGCARSNENHEELAQARAELEVARGELAQTRAELEVARGEAAKSRAEAEAAKAALQKPRQPTGITFAIHGYEGANEAREYGPLKAEFEKRGFLCKIVRSPKTKTPNQDRAKVMVEALKNVEGDIILVGISNQGLFMPLVAAERPIRRIVMINAVVPTPGKSFREAFDFKEVFAWQLTAMVAQRAPGMSEVCPLKELPTVEYVYVCGEKDEAIRPEWEQQRAARESLHVEPVVVKGAGHANIVAKYAKEVVDAATKGL